MTTSSTNGSNGKRLTTPQAVNSAIIAVCDVMRRSNVAGAMQYVPELTWILFLRIFDEREIIEAEEAEAFKRTFTPSLIYPYRWQDWAAPNAPHRIALWDQGQGALFKFVNTELLPYLRGLRNDPHATPRQRVISQMMEAVERIRIDTERNLLDVLDRIHEISEANIDPTHVFPISQAYEGLLLRMGEKNNDGGQFFTPREVIRAMVEVIKPQIGETIYDPACGTGGFLAQAYEHLYRPDIDPLSSETLKRQTFYGREKENLIYPIALANLLLHGIDEPHIWHGNTLTDQEVYGGLFEDAPETFDVILTNPPFGGKENKDAQSRFVYRTSATQVLFVQHVIDSLKDGGRCAIVLDEGVLFRTNETAFVQTKRKLLDECDVWCIVSLPAGTFISAGGAVKTNILFFTKGKRTERIWYYDLSEIKVTKKRPVLRADFDAFIEILLERSESPQSWTIDFAQRSAAAHQKAETLRANAQEPEWKAREIREQISDLKRNRKSDKDAIATLETQAAEFERQARDIEKKASAIEDAVYDLKAVNPFVSDSAKPPTMAELLDIIEREGQKVADALARLRELQARRNN